MRLVGHICFSSMFSISVNGFTFGLKSSAGLLMPPLLRSVFGHEVSRRDIGSSGKRLVLSGQPPLGSAKTMRNRRCRFPWLVRIPWPTRFAQLNRWQLIQGIEETLVHFYIGGPIDQVICAHVENFKVQWREAREQFRASQETKASKKRIRWILPWK